MLGITDNVFDIDMQYRRTVLPWLEDSVELNIYYIYGKLLDRLVDIISLTVASS